MSHLYKFCHIPSRPSTGIYYAVRTPLRWELMTCLFDNAIGPDHFNYQEAWVQSVASVLASMWSRQLKSPHKFMYKLLLNHMCGFPRGRISLSADTRSYSINHGNNLTPAMDLTRPFIEQAFGLKKARWTFDDHERNLQKDKMVIRDLFKIEEDWPAFELAE